MSSIKKKAPIKGSVEAGHKLLKLFGRGGKHWIKGQYADDDGNYCLIGAARKVKCVATLRASHAKFMGDGWVASVESWNDSLDMTWPKVKAFLLKMARGQISKAALLLIIVGMVACCPRAYANTPGKHTIKYTWVDAGCDASLTCTYNIYQANTTGACGDGKFPTYTNISPNSLGDFFVTPSLSAGTYFAAVTAFDPTKGGESTCSAEVQSSVPAITTPTPTSPAGTVQ